MFLEYIYMITSVVVIVKYIFTVFICICNSKMCSLNHFCSCNTKIFAICVKKIYYSQQILKTDQAQTGVQSWSTYLLLLTQITQLQKYGQIIGKLYGLIHVCTFICMITVINRMFMQILKSRRFTLEFFSILCLN